MFYDTEKNDHNLPYNPYKSIVVPRPIGWISSLDEQGSVNLAPYSQFNNLGYDPPYVMFSGSHKPSGDMKDSVANILRTGEFVCNMATYELRKAVVKSAEYFPAYVDEMEAIGLTKEASRLVKPPRVAESPVHLECKLHNILVLPGYFHQNTTHVVVGQVVGVHIRDDALTSEGKLDIARLRPLARLGYQDYSSVTDVFSMMSEGPDADSLNAGLGGEAKGKRE